MITTADYWNKAAAFEGVEDALNGVAQSSTPYHAPVEAAKHQFTQDLLPVERREGLLRRSARAVGTYLPSVGLGVAGAIGGLAAGRALNGPLGLGAQPDSGFLGQHVTPEIAPMILSGALGALGATYGSNLGRRAFGHPDLLLPGEHGGPGLDLSAGKKLMSGLKHFNPDRAYA